MEDRIKARKNEVAESTYELHYVILGKLKRYKKDLMLSEVDLKFLEDFQKHLYNKLKNKPNTVYNAMKTLKIYIRKAVQMKLITENPFDLFKLKIVRNMPVFLTEEERDLLIKTYYSPTTKQTQKNVLRWFIFSCFTGLRISDVRAVKLDEIYNGILSFTPIKTINVNNMRVNMPLSRMALEMIKEEGSKTQLIFNCYAEPVMRRYLAEVIKKVGITKEITYHSSRHTFATAFLKTCTHSNGLLILQKLLGHAKINSTMIYTHVLTKDIRDAIDNFDS